METREGIPCRDCENELQKTEGLFMCPYCGAFFPKIGWWGRFGILTTILPLTMGLLILLGLFLKFHLKH